MLQLVNKDIKLLLFSAIEQNYYELATSFSKPQRFNSIHTSLTDVLIRFHLVLNSYIKALKNKEN